MDWLIPGIIGLNIMFTGLWGLAFSIVQARMRKLLKRLVASPMRRREYLLAQMLARLLFLAPEVVVPLAFGALVLGMPIHGSFRRDRRRRGGRGAGVRRARACCSAAGHAPSRRISGLVNAATLPMWLLSGVFFSASNFPDAFQPVIQALPLTALVDAFRGVVLEGAGLRDVGGELLILGAWTVAPFFLALRLFSWR